MALLVRKWGPGPFLVYHKDDIVPQNVVWMDQNGVEYQEPSDGEVVTILWLRENADCGLPIAETTVDMVDVVQRGP